MKNKLPTKLLKQ